MSSSLESLLAEHAELEGKLADPTIHTDPAGARKLGRRYAELAPIMRTARELDQVRGDLRDAHELASEDPTFADEVTALTEQLTQLETKLTELLPPRDPHDPSDVVLEIKSGEGGEESALFAADLLNMYLRYAERQGWKAEILDGTESDLGGYKDVTVAIKSRSTSPDGVWSRLKYEGGVHRVQRVPVTESQDRVHTSAAGVLIFPEIEDVEIKIEDKDLRIDVYRSQGKGGQGVNTTDSAVRLTHIPTGIVVTCQNERSQLQNKARAMQVLQARLTALAEEKAEAQAANARRSQIRTVDRSERVRTYSFPESRLSDHRSGFKAYNLDQVLAGDLDPVLDSLAAADRAERLAH